MDIKCDDIGLANLLYIAKKILQIIQIIGPILAIIGLVIIFIKLMSNPDNKKLKNGIRNCLLSLVLLFVIPIIVDVIMKLFDSSFSFASCWTYAEQIKTGNYQYVDNDKNKVHIIEDPNLYESQSREIDSDYGSVSEDKIIFIGESRTLGMKQVVNSNDVWSCSEESNLAWLQSVGIPQIEENISSGTDIVILMGINDLYEPDSYISYINSKIDYLEEKGANTYFVSVMPTEGEYDNLNSEIDLFNEKIRNGISRKIRWIDANSYLKSVGFKTTDGLHYDLETYQKIYNYIKSNL